MDKESLSIKMEKRFQPLVEETECHLLRPTRREKGVLLLVDFLYGELGRMAQWKWMN